MRAVIFSGGNIKDYNYIRAHLRSTDLIIAADSGLEHLLKLGITPDIFIGDMDSVISEVVAKEIIKLEVMKDETDTEAAVKLALERGAKEILMLASCGTRLDHTLANIFLLKELDRKGITAKIIDDNNEIYYFENDIEIKGEIGDTLSIIPLSDLDGVSTSGLLYQLDDEMLEFGKSRGVSNVLTNESCAIKASSGEALVIKSKD